MAQKMKEGAANFNGDVDDYKGKIDNANNDAGDDDDDDDDDDDGKDVLVNNDDEEGEEEVDEDDENDDNNDEEKVDQEPHENDGNRNDEGDTNDEKGRENQEEKENIAGNIKAGLDHEVNEIPQGKRRHDFQGQNGNNPNIEGEGKGNIKNILDGNRIMRENKEIIYNGTFKLHESIDGTPVKKVILLTYQRAGSSFTGELLTAGGEAMYVFEPLYVWRRKLGPGADPSLERKSALVLGDLLDCRPEVIAEWQRKGFSYFRRKLEVENFCEAAKLRLLKTIRARAHFILPWIKERPDIKIVHLVRDPRGIVNSVQRGGRLWSDNNRNAQLQCKSVERDLELEHLGPDRYLRVRYEDLVDKPVEESKRIFALLGMTFSKGVMEYLESHTGTGENQERRPGYFNTFRKSDFRHDLWKQKLDNREIEFIENICSSIMKAIGYTALPPT
ncbi:carbohydrate sulfotransferase 1-like [Macrobrachium rosenbergii]|uniref:carbohydrate sulfotransferase 1-like n=1 Tax=Macrobrachium rosenbergii TaxID=79674 RepID=UPI0034D3BB92